MNQNNIYVVKDSLGNTMAVFKDYKQAVTYKLAYGHSGYTIKKVVKNVHKRPTEKQLKAVHFILNIFIDLEFEGDINDYKDVSLFLDSYLEEAKRIQAELSL